VVSWSDKLRDGQGWTRTHIHNNKLYVRNFDPSEGPRAWEEEVSEPIGTRRSDEPRTLPEETQSRIEQSFR